LRPVSSAGSTPAIIAGFGRWTPGVICRGVGGGGGAPPTRWAETTLDVTSTHAHAVAAMAARVNPFV
jgi:hypothetical protein